MTRARVALGASLLLAGCALESPYTWERPGGSAADFRRDDYVCQDLSQMKWGTIGSRGRYAECMEAHGYVGQPKSH